MGPVPNDEGFGAMRYSVEMRGGQHEERRRSRQVKVAANMKFEGFAYPANLTTNSLFSP